jgi:hypothetical protein
MLRIPRANAFRRNPLTVSGAEARELLLSRGGDDPAFVGLVVDGDLYLEHTPIESLPAGLKVRGSLTLDYSQIRSLPAGLKVGRNLNLSYSKIKSLPAGLQVGGRLGLHDTPIESLPEGLQVGGSLHLGYSQIRSLPEGLKVGGDLRLSHTPIQSLPAGLQVGGDLYLLGTRVRALPVDLRVRGQIVGFDPPTPPDQIFPVTSYGKMTGTILKLNKPDAPQTLADLQQRHPNEFERFRSAMTNAKVGASPKAPIAQVKKAVEAHSLSTTPWLLTYGVYTSPLQKYCKSYNKVIKLNIDISKYDKAQKKALGLLAQAAKRSGHPYETGDLFTIGWVRICADNQNKIWLIEEIQSDVQSVRRKQDLSQYPHLAAAAEVMAPIAKRFYHDILGIVFDKAEKIGYTVQMLDYPAKREIVLRSGSKPPPIINYTSLPQDMGMRLTSEPSLTLPQVGPVWSYKPNPRRRR